MMSAELILKNICSFLEVLQSAHTDRVAHWTPEALHNARRWAQYCTQIYKQAEGKSYQTDLDEQIRSLAQLPWILDDLVIELNMLRDASDLLRRALLQNPHLNPDLFAQVWQTMAPVPGDADHIQTQAQMSKACLEWSQSHAGGLIADRLHQLLCRWSGGDCSGDKRKEPEKCKGQLLLAYIATTLQTTPPDDLERTKAQLQVKLGQQTTHEAGLHLILTALASRVADELETEALALLLQVVLNSQQGIQQHVLKMPKVLLRHIAASSFQFYRLYLHQLVQTVPLVGPQDLSLLLPNSYSTRSRPCQAAYNDLQSHFTSLLNTPVGLSQDDSHVNSARGHVTASPDHVSKATDRALRSLTSDASDQRQMWRVVLQDLSLDINKFNFDG